MEGDKEKQRAAEREEGDKLRSTGGDRAHELSGG